MICGLLYDMCAVVLYLVCCMKCGIFFGRWAGV